MPAECDSDFLPIISAIPGPRGAAGATGAPGAAASAGRNSFTTTAANFTMPAANGNVSVIVVDSAWMAAGQPIFIETAGHFLVVSVDSAVSATLQARSIPTNAAAGTLITFPRKVTPGGYLYVDPTAIDDLDDRVTDLETAPGANRAYYGTTAPTGGTYNINDSWYDTNDGYKHYRWDGSAWVAANRVVDLADFGTGIRPIVKVSTLPSSGYTDGDFVWLESDGKLYRRVSGAWTKAIAAADLTGQVDASTFIVDGTIIAQKLGANSVTADKVGSNQIITRAANIGGSVVNSSHISSLEAGKITAGDIQTVNIGIAGRLFSPSAFDATGSQATATATVEGGAVTSIAVTGGGSGYNSPPTISISGGGGSGAYAVANVVAGAVVSVTVVSPGSGYTSTPTVSIAQNVVYRKFRAVEFATTNGTGKVFSAGNALSAGYGHATPVLAYCPGNAGWTSGTVTACPDASNKVRVLVNARLIGYTGNLLVYVKVGSTFTALAAIASSVSGNATYTCFREIYATLTDSISIYVAPADGSGTVTPATCGYELEATFFNW